MYSSAAAHSSAVSTEDKLCINSEGSLIRHRMFTLSVRRLSASFYIAQPDFLPFFRPDLACRTLNFTSKSVRDVCMTTHYWTHSTDGQYCSSILILNVQSSVNMPRYRPCVPSVRNALGYCYFCRTSNKQISSFIRYCLFLLGCKGKTRG